MQERKKMGTTLYRRQKPKYDNKNLYFILTNLLVIFQVREIYVPKQKGDEELFGNEISTGINFDKYFDKEIPVECKAS